jgi:hypothetical protein
MWRSVVTCIPIQLKPISKQSQHTIEDLEILQQEQLVQDPTGYNRQVLPNIRPKPKSKFIYKGLAYKEVKKIPGITNENDEKIGTNSLKKPLIDYNLSQAYIRYEVNTQRIKQTFRQPLAQPATTPVSTLKSAALIKTHTSMDLREIRKRIIRGTTLSCRPTPQTPLRTPGRADTKSALSPEVVLPILSLSTLKNAPTISPLGLTSPLRQHVTIHTTPIISQNFDSIPINNLTNVSSL